MSFVYLAAPYSHENPAVRELRYQMINAFAARVMAAGHAVFSPISQSHEIARYMDDRYALDHDFWMGMDLPVLAQAGIVYVLMLDGWRQSRGVRTEIARALELGKDIAYFQFDTHVDRGLRIGVVP